MYQGSCLCGTVKIEISGEIKAVTHCHCKMCQKAHGAAFATFASSRDEHFSIVQGADDIKSYESSPGVFRTFCVHCGSNIQWIHDSEFNRGWSSFALSILDTPFEESKQKHIYIDSKVPWLNLCDDFPRHQC